MANENRLDSELKRQEQLLASVLSAGDADALDQILASDYLFTSAQGETWGRDRAIADVTAAAFRVNHLAVQVERVIGWSNVAVVVGRAEVQGQVGAQQLSGGFRFTHVWRRGEGGWQLVAGHTSRVPEWMEDGIGRAFDEAAQQRAAPDDGRIHVRRQSALSDMTARTDSMLRAATPMIHVPDVRATAAWYEGIGFTVLETFGNGADGLSFAILSVGDTRVMFNQGGRTTPDDRREVDLYVDVTNVDALFAKLKDRVDVIQSLQDTDYGMREFIIRDPNGFWITFGQNRGPS